MYPFSESWIVKGLIQGHIGVLTGMQVKVFGELFFTHIILKNPNALEVLKMCLQEKTFLKAERESTAILILAELNFPCGGEEQVCLTSRVKGTCN